MGDWYDFLVPDGVEGAGPAPSKSKTVTVVPIKGVYDKADYVGLCAQAGFGADTITAARVAWRETRGRPRQINKQAISKRGCPNGGDRSLHAHGLFQIVPACFLDFDPGRGVTDPAYNAKYAAGVVAKSGWGAWEAGTGQTPPAGLDKAAGPIKEWSDPLSKDDDHFRTAVRRGYLDGTGAASDAVGGTTSGALDPSGVIDTAEDAAEFFTSWSTWRRVLLVVSGGALTVVGLMVISGDLGDPFSKLANLNPATAIAKGAIS